MCASTLDLFSRFNLKLETVATNWFNKWIWHNGRGWLNVKVQFMVWYVDRISKKMIIKLGERQKILEQVALGGIREFEVLL
jgi:hypothetical protein